MSSQVEETDPPNHQPSFVFGEPKAQTPRGESPEETEPSELSEHHCPETVCLSRTSLKKVSEHFIRNSSLKYLYLEGNDISSLPCLMFTGLPNLLWLDLRHNHIESLPAEIGLHRALKTLLLEGNPISELPVELGNVITLKGLNLRNCPISFPPQDIVHQGLQCILQYLRSAMAKRPVSVRKSPPEMPVVEKLQLSELMGSSLEEQDDTLDKEELQKFRELKDKLSLLDKTELESAAQGDRHAVPRLLLNTKRKKVTTKAGIIPQLHLFDTQLWRRPEERRQNAMKELKEKQAIIVQRKKSQEALWKWRTQSKITQERKMSEHKRKKQQQRKQKEAEAESQPGDEDGSESPQRQLSSLSIREDEEFRSTRYLERRIRAHVEKMQERRRNPTGTRAEQIAAAEQDVEEMRRLQNQLLEKRQRRGFEHFSTIFTADPSFLE
ncbi:leucine-rich repeat-containing protein 27-like [Sphaeramia orbicularis]|uniref:leucine-rich repeat-containing protein 27-like n=1 Tax=Sphaeramia orbicularis TaxID=375764 RepID=UPI00117DCEC5|nr:leucine-rich repeat-containing protein 27 [Sphaeramia orbicularis]